MSEFDAELRRAGELAEECPNIAAHPCAEPGEQAEIDRKVERWLAMVADWTTHAMENDDFREFAHDQINWSISQLRYSPEVLVEMEKLRDLLCNGYDWIRQRADMNEQVDLPVTDMDDGRSYCRSFEEHVEDAKSVIESLFRDLRLSLGPAMLFENYHLED